MAKWLPTRHASVGGRFALVMTRREIGGTATVVSTVRGAQTQLNSYSAADPFGDSVAEFAFPSISAFDDLDAPDIAPWLNRYADVDLYWVPAIAPSDDRYGDLPAVIDSVSGQHDVIVPRYTRAADGTRNGWNWIKVWEGFVSSLEFNVSDTGSQLTVQCQGALFQLDHYLQKPFYPSRPWPLEALIRDVFSHERKPHLRTQPLKIAWPSGWTKVVPPYAKGGANLYTPVAKPGHKWSGLSSRNSGSWEHSLTGFVQDQLAVMITGNDCGVAPGNQFTVQQQRASATNHGRQPVLMVRDRFRTPDFALWVGTPGMQLQLAADSTQSENLVYGTGTDVNGDNWRNAVINDDGSRTDYLPLAAARQVYPAIRKHNPAFNDRAFASEAYVSFGAGFSQTDAQTVAAQQLARDQEPGWSGSINLTVDPSDELPRWLIRPGMTVLLKGFAGSGERGVPFHVASVEAAPMDGSVRLTVDTRYRDLLTVAEAQARTRDPLNPVRMLQVNKTSVLIDDIQAPWDYKAGSGFIPRAAHHSYEHKPGRIIYPYNEWVRSHPPLHFPHWYVKCNASAGYHDGQWQQTPKFRRRRWAGPVPILTAEKGTITRSEFFVVDVYGRPVKAPFHVSLYDRNVHTDAMPRDGHGPSPYIDGAFESINPATGQAWPSGNFFQPNEGFLVGWGNRAAGIYNRAGFSPGAEAEGHPPTGQLFDDAQWAFDNTGNGRFDPQALPGKQRDKSAVLIYAMFYCEWHTPVYFQGRLFRQNPGTG